VDEEKGKYKAEKEGAKTTLPTNTLQGRGGQMCHVPGDVKNKDGHSNPGYVQENQSGPANDKGARAGALHRHRDVALESAL